MRADPPSFVADVAAQVVAWHNRHPLARRIARRDVQSVGIVVLPFAREGQPPWHAAAPKRGLLALMFPKRVNRRPWAVFSEDALPEIGPKRLAAFALRHGFVERPGPAELPERVLQSDRDLLDAPRGDLPPERLNRYLVTAAIDLGPSRPRLVLGHGRRMPVQGQRLWSVPRLAALGGATMASLLIGVAALWLVATKRPAEPVIAARPASAPKAASAASVASAAAASAAHVGAASATAPVAAASSPAAVAAVAPPAPVASVAVPTPVASAPAVVASAPTPRPSAPAIVVPPPVLASAPAAASAPAVIAAPPPASAPLAEAQRASAPLVPRLKPDLAEAARAERQQHPGLPQPASRPPPAASAGPARFYALVTRPMRQRADAEAVLKRLRAETTRIAHPTAIETDLQQTPEGWRVTWWPFTHARQAENARAALAARGVALEMVDF
ncbi:hypothetical protein HLB44_07725 [Aquincola sp. S2]|uniref:SPOR domain-containing protein n=1 Tax=Pseudaquabacterium terrae TaxID=2732868 RepID=A0ABX2EE30_9BURK|nr:hypothetical protein [Aquabacterium terrae]NRF66868.1 hypothetical protein [Aquabacterium terrae]